MTREPDEVVPSGKPALQEVIRLLDEGQFDPFAGSTLERPRLLWHPQIHRHYGERCLFFLVRVQDQPFSVALEELGRLVNECEISSNSISLLYGYYDALIRVWAGPHARERLTTLLRDRTNLVAEFEEFQVEKIQYGWSKEFAEKNALDIESRRREIQAVCDAIERDTPIEVAGLRRLADDGLIYPLGTRPRRSVRFYILFAPLPKTSMTSVRGLSRVEDGLVRAGLNPVTTVYSGIGFAAHLLSLYAEDLESVRQDLVKVEPIANDLGMRTITLIVANPDVTENDALDPHAEVPNELAGLASILGPGFETQISHLDLEVQIELGRLFRRYTHLLGSKYKGLFLAVCRARIEGRVGALTSELSLILHFELLFRTYVLDVLDRCGADDATVLTAVRGLPKVEADLKRDPSRDKLSMGTLAQIASSLAIAGHVSQDELTELFTDTFPRNIVELTTSIRNPLAHGRTYEPAFEAKFMAEWKSRAELICHIGEIYVKLEQMQQLSVSGSDAE